MTRIFLTGMGFFSEREFLQEKYVDHSEWSVVDTCPCGVQIHRRPSFRPRPCPRCAAAAKEAERRERRAHNERRRYERIHGAVAQRACEGCGEAFLPHRRDARFCSTRCRVAAHRATRH